MEYKGLEQIRNKYPVDVTNEDINDSYQKDGNSIIYTGLYPENFISFEMLSLDDIKLGDLKTDPNIIFKFIIRFINDDGSSEDWTSEVFLNSLRQGQLDDNPFFTRDKVVVAEINFSLLHTYHGLAKFADGEAYAEVLVTDTITTKEDILKHINWVVGSSVEQEEIRLVETFGAWERQTTEKLGFPDN
mgnify:CR=1 FL=1